MSSFSMYQRLSGKDRDAIADWMDRNEVPSTTFEIEVISEKPPHAIVRYFRAQKGVLLIDEKLQLKTNEIHVFDLPPIPK